MPAPLSAQQIACNVQTTSQQPPGGGCRLIWHFGEQCPPDLFTPAATQSRQAPRARRHPDPLAEVSESLLVALLERHPALTPKTLLENLQDQRPDQDWSSVKSTLQRRVQHLKALHCPVLKLMFPLRFQPGEISFSNFTKV